MSWSCPFHSFQLPLHHFLGMSASFSMYVPFFFCESFPYISRRADWFPCPLFPFHSPCTPLVFISVPFMSFSVPLSFRLASLSCRLPISSPHFLALLCIEFLFAPQYFPQKNTVLPAFSQRGHQQTQSFSRCSAKAGRTPAGGFEPGTPVLRQRLCLVERHQITAQYVLDPPPKKTTTKTTYLSSGGGGVLSSVLSLVSNTPPQCRRIFKFFQEAEANGSK